LGLKLFIEAQASISVPSTPVDGRTIPRGGAAGAAKPGWQPCGGRRIRGGDAARYPVLPASQQIGEPMSRHSTGGSDRTDYIAEIFNCTRRVGPDRWDVALANAKRRVDAKRGAHGADKALLEGVGAEFGSLVGSWPLPHRNSGTQPPSPHCINASPPPAGSRCNPRPRPGPLLPRSGPFRVSAESA
jgi:hypothetical protein